MEPLGSTLASGVLSEGQGVCFRLSRGFQNKIVSLSCSVLLQDTLFPALEVPGCLLGQRPTHCVITFFVCLFPWTEPEFWGKEGWHRLEAVVVGGGAGVSVVDSLGTALLMDERMGGGGSGQAECGTRRIEEHFRRLLWASGCLAVPESLLSERQLINCYFSLVSGHTQRCRGSS